MTKDRFYEELGKVNATRLCRTTYANIVINDPSLFEPLLDILFMVDDKRSTKAAWIFEFVCKADMRFLLPHLELFFTNIHKLKLDSAVRPCSKIIELLMIAYYKEKDAEIQRHITPQHKELLIEYCFDRLIREEKVAVKVYAMTSLYFLGTEFDWIHSELKTIIEKDYYQQSAGFKAKSRHILKLISSE